MSHDSAIPGARYVHTNLIARDWRALARFYENATGVVLTAIARYGTSDS